MCQRLDINQIMRKIYTVLLIYFCIAPLLVNSSELDTALDLQANLENGAKVYKLCATCHGKEGWGKLDGSFPVIAGQHSKVVIKQLSDIRSRNRENPTMFPFSDPATIGGAQSVADVAEYIKQLPAPLNWGKGSGESIDDGRKLYKALCGDCHGAEAQGVAEAFFPKLQGQHFNYLLRQINSIKNGKRKNANPVMVDRIKALNEVKLVALVDYISSL